MIIAEPVIAGRSDLGNDPVMQLTREGGIDPKSSTQTADDSRLFKTWETHEQEKWKVSLGL